MSVLLLGKHFHNKSPFWDNYSCRVFDLMSGCLSSCWEDIFLMSLLSGAGLSDGFVISCSGFSLPVDKRLRHFLNESSFWGESSCLVCNIRFFLVSLILGPNACSPVGS